MWVCIHSKTYWNACKRAVRLFLTFWDGKDTKIPSFECFWQNSYSSREHWLIPTIDYYLSLYTMNWDIPSTSRRFLLLYTPLEVQPLSRDASEYTPVYILIYPCGEVCMAYVSSEIPLIWGVTVLHIMNMQLQKNWYLYKNSQAVKKKCAAPKSLGKKRCEIKDGGQEIVNCDNSSMAKILIMTIQMNLVSSPSETWRKTNLPKLSLLKFLLLTFHHSHL